MPIDYFRLGNGFVIRKIKFNERLNFEYGFEIKENEIFMIEFSSEIRSIEGITGFPTGHDDLKLEFMKGFLQIFKAGKFGYRAIYTKIPRFDFDISTTVGSSHPNYFMPPRYPNYSISKSDVKNLKNFGKKYVRLYTQNKKLEPVFIIAVNRFLKAVEEFDLEDKIIDLVISLECLFGDDQEIRFKIALRVSNFLGGNSSERLIIFNFIKEIYQIRNKLVHGGTDYSRGIKINGRNVKFKDIYYYLESITRFSIQKYIVFSNVNTSRDKMKKLIDMDLVLNSKKFTKKIFSSTFNNEIKALSKLYKVSRKN
jgi:hypothetical protein